MNFDISKLSEILKSNNIDISKLEGAKDKDVETNCLWDQVSGEGYNEDLMTRDGFVEKFYSENGKNPMSEEQLGIIYDIVSAIDGEKDMSGKELKILAGINGDGNNIEQKDIKKLVEMIEEASSISGNKTILKDNDKILEDKDGRKYVKVEAWNLGKQNSNNCLSRIIANSYDLNAMGIKMYSKEYKELENAVMNANPNIYGTEESGWRKEVGGTGRHNAVIYTSDKIYLPEF